MQLTPAAQAPEAGQSAYAPQVAQHRATIRAHYTGAQQAAIRLLYETVQVMADTSGGRTCAKLLLGLYNGNRFPFDLTDLRRLDSARLQAALTVIQMDAARCYCEVHELLNAIYDDGCSTGAEFEHWAYDMKWGRHEKRANLAAPTLIRRLDRKQLLERVL